MALDNPTVMCARHAARFYKTSENVDNDGSQTLVSQYWAADCGCGPIEITLAIPNPPQPNN